MPQVVFFEDLFTKEYYGHTIIQWSLAFGGVLISFILGKIADWILNKYVKKIATKFGKDLGAMLLGVVEKPTRILVVGMDFLFPYEFFNLARKNSGCGQLGILLPCCCPDRLGHFGLERCFIAALCLALD